MPAYAPVEVIQEAVAAIKELQLTDEHTAVLIKYGVKVGWRNLGKILKGWSAEEIKSGKKQPAGTPAEKPVVQVRKPKPRKAAKK